MLKLLPLKMLRHFKKDFPLPQPWKCLKCSLGCLPFSSIDQNNLLLTIHGTRESDIQILNEGPSFSMKSILNKMPGQKFPTDDFLDDSIKSKYYSPGDFLNEKISHNGLSIMHLNIASLQKHIDELRSLLYSLKHTFDIVSISETRLYDEKPLTNIEIDGFQFISTPTLTQCGGVGMYINSSLDFDLLKDLSVCHSNVCESIFVEIKNPSKKNIIVGNIYRHHTAVEDFLNIFMRPTMQKITKTKKTCILSGDFNVDLAQYGNNNIVDNFYDEITSFCFRPLILQPSRVTSKSLTLIDNIFINDVSCHSSGGNITCSISDHFSQFSHLDIYEKNHTSKNIKFSRDWKNFNKQRFSYEISNLDWNNVTSLEYDANASLQNFYNKIDNLLDEMAPVKRLTKKEKGLIERPWISSGILKSMASRDKCYQEFFDESDQTLKLTKFNTYKSKRNMVTTLLRNAKKKYYSDFFLEHQSNIKKTWEGIRSLINV